VSKTSGCTGYLHMGGTDILHVIVQTSGEIVTYAGRQLVEDVDLVAARWITQRSVVALASQAGVSADLASFALVGPNGGLTKFAQALNADDGGRNSNFLTTEAFVAKMDAKRAKDLLAAMYTEYAASTVAAAA
jgi:hypothetical protein